MSIPYWSPLAGAIQLRALNAAKASVAQRYSAESYNSLALSGERVKRPSVRDVERAKKCPGCGSHTYAMTQRGRICSYCRAPEGEGA